MKYGMRVLAVCLAAMFLFEGGVALAQSYDPDQDIPRPTMLQKRLNKLGRGLANVVFGWTEIPLTWHRQIIAQKPLTHIITTGTVMGTTRAGMRMGVGVYEIVTTPSTISFVEKLIVIGLYGGMLLIFISVLRQRLFERKTSRYKDVEI